MMRFLVIALALTLLAVPLVLLILVDRAGASEPEVGQEHQWGYECAAFLAGVKPTSVVIPVWSEGPISQCGEARNVSGCFQFGIRRMTLRRLFGSRLLRVAVHEGHHAVQEDQGWPRHQRDAIHAADQWRDCLNFMP